MAIKYNPSIVTDGLVLCIDAGNIKSYPGIGTSWYGLDSTGNRAYLDNGATYVDDGVRSISFDGTNDYFYTTNQLNNPTDITVSIWFKYLDNGSQTTLLMFNDTQRGTPSVNSDFIMYLSNSSGLINVQTYRSTISGPSYNAYNNDNKWHSLIVSTEEVGEQYKFTSLLDGVSTIFTTGNAIIPNMAGYYRNTNFSGNIAHLSVYHRALSIDEMKQCFNALKGRFGL